MTQFAIFPLFGLTVSVTDNLLISSIFTGVSLLRGYALRRLFEAFRAKAACYSTPRGLRDEYRSRSANKGHNRTWHQTSACAAPLSG